MRNRSTRQPAGNRGFFNQQALIAAYRQELLRPVGEPRILNVTGMGGIGKSRSLRHLRQLSDERRTALVDFRLPGSHQLESFLAQLRQEFGAQHVRFPRFDLAFRELRRRMHPAENPRQPDPFGGGANSLGRMAEAWTGPTITGAVFGGVWMVWLGQRRLHDQRLMKSDPDLADLPQLSTEALIGKLIALLGEELDQGCQGSPYVVFVDTYEFLPSGQDNWLRALVPRLRHGLVVIASRDPLLQEFWPVPITWAEVERLNPAHCEAYLRRSGMSDPDQRRAVAKASEGLPFYLDLAIDTPGGPGRNPPTGTAVSQALIERRFLEHVPEKTQNVLQVLSLARLFSEEMYEQLRRDLQLAWYPRLWDELTRYSFVSEGPEGWYQLHQLMVRALHANWPASGRARVHGRLRKFWERLADKPDGAAGPGPASFAPRQEAVYHGLRSGSMSVSRVLDHVDLSQAGTGSQAVRGIADDLRAFVREFPDASDRIRSLAACVEAEVLLAQGDGPAALEALAGTSAPSGSTLDARLTMARADAMRLKGTTHEARDGYRRLWHEGTGATRLQGGYALADIIMCAGDFRQARSLAAEVYEAPDGDQVLRARTLRLLHLLFRFQLDFPASEALLDRAEAGFREKPRPDHLADIQTNRVELLAFTDPPQALATAVGALAAQRGLGAWHEVGKTLTAQAIAYTRLADFENAEHAFAEAKEVLHISNYRSGRIRAELFHAFLHLRRNREEAALRSLRESGRMFEAAGVYPFLSMLAYKTTVHIGRPSAELEHMCDRAARSVTLTDPDDSLASYELRMERLIADLLSDSR
ncbi:hypothetical protein AB0M28_19120 [Streptomyces sp. NPDC051940]|uniref:hypothetical protein n=1 Tax=Streptomyces sp. NPDC051940 TaxID=3155675 RepID=UPI0034190472